MILNKPGIYQILCFANNKIYIGQSINLKKRENTHFSLLRHNKSHNIHLQAAFDKYGEEYFRFSALEYCSIDNLDEREIYWENILPKEMKFNNRPIESSTNRGIVRSVETRYKLAQINVGRSLSEEHKKKTSDSMKGIPKTEEHRQNIIKAKLKKAFSVSQIDLNTNEVLASFESLNQASRETGIGLGNIAGARDKDNRTAGGFKWKTI